MRRRTWFGIPRTRRRGLARAGLAGLLFVALSPAVAQRSSRFVMDRLTVSAVAGEASSGRFATAAVVAQSPVAGAVSRCNQGFVSGVGFWSVKGAVAVPISLRLSLNQAEPDTLDLQWTGSDPQFRLFRSAVAQDVTDPANRVVETPSCSHVETEPVDAGVVFYKVLAARDP